MALSAAFTRVIVVMALLAAFTYQMSAVDGGKHPVSPASLDPPQENLFLATAPYMATITSVNKFTDKTCNVTIKHDGNVPAWEGMVYAVGMPDENATHYFMLASTRYGDLFDGKTATLCVRDVGGDTSHHLCNAEPGSKLGLAGPYYRNMLLPQDNPNATQIMVASDTGIGPFRGYLRRMFVEDVPFHFTGVARLFYGANDTRSIFYDEELSKYAQENSTNFVYKKATDGQKEATAAVRLSRKASLGYTANLRAELPI